MNGKIKRILGVAAAGLVAAALTLLAGCSLPGDSIRDVIDDFTSAVNTRDAEGVKDTLDSDADAYSQAATSTWFTSYFPETDYSIDSFSDSGKTARVVFASDTGAGLDYTFEMTEEEGTMFAGGTFKIRRIKNSASSTYFFE